jgi:hypothetical protein
VFGVQATGMGAWAFMAWLDGVHERAWRSMSLTLNL